MAKRTKTVKDFTFAAGLKLFVLVGGLLGTAAYCEQRYTIGVDSQQYRCLDQKYFLIDRWRKPSFSELQRGDLVVVSMKESQRPDNALWPAGQIMIKRLLAREAGTTMAVSEAGVTFSLDGEEWSWGTALEAAGALGRSASEFVRTETLGPEEAYLMGDRRLSFDSRYYGPIQQEQVVGAVIWAF